MRRVWPIALMLSGLTWLTACSGQESEEERQARMLQAERDSIAMADSLYESVVFDTLTWESREARLERGGVVWRSSCQKCHGADGKGAGELARQLEIEVPPLSVDTTDPAAIRRAIFVGHEGAMPNWGLHGLKYRDIDAVTAYIVQQLAAPEGSDNSRAWASPAIASPARSGADRGGWTGASKPGSARP